MHDLALQHAREVASGSGQTAAAPPQVAAALAVPWPCETSEASLQLEDGFMDSVVITVQMLLLG